MTSRPVRLVDGFPPPPLLALVGLAYAGVLHVASVREVATGSEVPARAWLGIAVAALALFRLRAFNVVCEGASAGEEDRSVRREAAALHLLERLAQAAAGIEGVLSWSISERTVVAWLFVLPFAIPLPAVARRGPLADRRRRETVFLVPLVAALMVHAWAASGAPW